ncbi:MAG TPA: cyclic nucleotide-binding domain-containing protein [Anaeromyxobacteraceae bacterium]|nr:cyclic nucleotide-binding domain-containing protein [Anaeromyxobacteraceae bacterium]
MASEAREVWGDLAASAFVEENHLFRSLDDEARRDLVKLSRHQTFSPGERVIAFGQAGEEFFLVRDGLARVTVPRGGGAVELGTLEKGAFFGEFHLLTGDPHTADVSAVTELEVVRFPEPMILALCQRFPKMKKLLESVMAARQRANAERLGTPPP